MDITIASENGNENVTVGGEIGPESVAAQKDVDVLASKELSKIPLVEGQEAIDVDEEMDIFDEKEASEVELETGLTVTKANGETEEIGCGDEANNATGNEEENASKGEMDQMEEKTIPCSGVSYVDTPSENTPEEEEQGNSKDDSLSETPIDGSIQNGGHTIEDEGIAIPPSVSSAIITEGGLREENCAEEVNENTADDSVDKSETKVSNAEEEESLSIGLMSKDEECIDSDKGKEQVDADLETQAAEETIDCGKSKDQVDADITAKAEEEESGGNDVEKEVVTMEDDALPLASSSEEQQPDSLKEDEEYFNSLNQEELNWFKEHSSNIDTFAGKGLKCTSCLKPVHLAINSENGIIRHPLLGVGICRQCKLFYNEGKDWEKDEDGCDVFCRWCAQGGELILCDKCPAAFCTKCIQSNLGRKKASEITDKEEWSCLICDPKQIYDLRATYHSVFMSNKEGKVSMDDSQQSLKTKKRESMGTKTPAQMMQRPRNFVDENIKEAFKTLDVHRKCLDKETEKWIKADRKMDLDKVTSVVRSLRQVYAIMKQNMDLLDKAIVESFIKHFPKSSTRIHMGKVGLNVKEGSLTGRPSKMKAESKRKTKPMKKNPTKGKAQPKKKTTSKASTLTKKVASSAPTSSSRSRGPKTQEQVIRLSLTNKKSASGSDAKDIASAKSGKRKSTQGKPDRTGGNGGDVIDESSGIGTRKRRAPEVPLPSPKRAKPGPKSRTRKV